MKDVSPSDQRRGFQIHAFAFIPGIIAIFAINAFTGPHYWWALWVLLGWGIGLFAHWWFVLGPGQREPHGGVGD